MINIGSRREAFFDDYLIDTENTTVETRLCKPVEKEVTMTVRMRDADLYSVQFSKERG